MKDTGIIRRVDELGRLVIPKEIRKHLRIRDGDSVEIFIDDNGQIILKKHALFAGLEQSIEGLTKTLAEATGNTVLICDISNVVAASGRNSQNYIGLELNNKFIAIIENRRQTEANTLDIGDKIHIDTPSHVFPLVVQGDLFGAVIIIEDSRQLINNDIQIIQMMNKFLVRQLET